MDEWKEGRECLDERGRWGIKFEGKKVKWEGKGKERENRKWIE